MIKKYDTVTIRTVHILTQMKSKNNTLPNFLDSQDKKQLCKKIYIPYSLTHVESPHIVYLEREEAAHAQVGGREQPPEVQARVHYADHS